MLFCFLNFGKKSEAALRGSRTRDAQKRIVQMIRILAQRLLNSKSSDNFVSFISLVSVIGVALGVIALTVVTSVINGFEGELAKTVTRLNGDLLLYSRADPVGDADKVIEQIKRALPETKAVTTALLVDLMVSGPKAVSGALLEGYDLSTASQVVDLKSVILKGELPNVEGDVAIGKSLAEKIGAEVGTVIRLILPGFNGSHLPEIRSLKVSGILGLGMHEYDSKYLFTTQEVVQGLIKMPGKVSAFKIKLKAGADSTKASETLNSRFGFPFKAKDWGQLNHNLLYAIRLEKVVIGILLTTIVLVSAFNVISTLMMMIYDKARDIAILKAMGMRPSVSFILFVWIGSGIGFMGTGAGLILGLGINWILANTRLIELPADVYYFGFLPVVTRWEEILLIAFVALGVTCAATIFPAWRVSRASPAEGLRYD